MEVKNLTSPPTPLLKERGAGGDLIVVEDRLDGECVRHVHLMANEPIGDEAFRLYGIPSATAKVEAGQSAGSHYLKAEWIFRGVVDFHGICAAGKFRRLVAWNLEGYGQVREAINHAAIFFRGVFGGNPQFGFMRKLPRGVEHGTPLSLGATSPHLEEHKMGGVGELVLLEAEWMMERCVAVGGRANHLTPSPSPEGEGSSE